MSISQFLTNLEGLNIHIDVLDDQLKIRAPEGTLTPTLINELKEKKQEIIDFFQKVVLKKKYISIEPTEEKEYYASSSAQKRMYFLQQLDLEGTGYNILRGIPLPGHVDLEKLETTFKRLIDRHESLRTSFEIVEDKLVQKIHREVDFYIRSYNGFDSIDRSFNLSQAPLLRAGVIDSGPEGRILVIAMHHIISDAVSLQVLTRDFMALNAGEELPPLRLQYKDYSEWRRHRTEQEKLKQQEEYWLEVFNGEIPILDLPLDFPRPAVQNFDGDRLSIELGEEVTKPLETIASEVGVTMFMLLLAAFYVFLYKITGREDIVVGTPVAGRGHADLQKVIGLFVNTLALRNYPQGEKTFTGFLVELKERTLEAFNHETYPFEDLVNKVVLNRDSNRNPLFDVVFSLRDMNVKPGKMPGEKMEKGEEEKPRARRKEFETRVSKFDLTLDVISADGKMVFSFEYCTKLFKKETIETFAQYFKEVVLAVKENREIKLKDIELSHNFLDIKQGTLQEYQGDFGF